MLLERHDSSQGIQEMARQLLRSRLPTPNMHGVDFRKWPATNIIVLFAKCGMCECVEYLLDLGFDPDSTCKERSTALHHCTFVFNTIESIKNQRTAAPLEQEESEISLTGRLISKARASKASEDLAYIERLQERILQTMSLLVRRGADREATNRWMEAAIHGPALKGLERLASPAPPAPPRGALSLLDENAISSRFKEISIRGPALDSSRRLQCPAPPPTPPRRAPSLPAGVDGRAGG
eukprot:CAMPEP_0113714444 /NCGR_PEP_ID=MMETSP0038_2-20120614/32621_1 /TAXON_ID=2898 /ORGANISM="Cryptomonas paramecium" /LENGTH=237 /DNA_ID=CAMNT_0000641423 /DNA_START=63 /DNA_END=773 /DNA_ORIENTATION=+ /assembly_acc=CAM_ASM_000170